MGHVNRKRLLHFLKGKTPRIHARECQWNKHQRTKDTINGHWIATSDTYYQDANGYFWHRGRADDML
jgi:acyl-coenzyme A synthetase/AMP-(fatty) acid ligase